MCATAMTAQTTAARFYMITGQMPILAGRRRRKGMSNKVVDITILGDTRRKLLDLQTGDMRDGGPVLKPEQDLSARRERGASQDEKE